MPTQHISALLGATCCVRLATVLRLVVCCWLRFDHFQTWANNTQHVVTRRNMVAKRTQRVAPSNVAICCMDILRSLGRGLTLLPFRKKESSRHRTLTLYECETRFKRVQNVYYSCYLKILSNCTRELLYDYTFVIRLRKLRMCAH